MYFSTKRIKELTETDTTMKLMFQFADEDFKQKV